MTQRIARALWRSARLVAHLAHGTWLIKRRFPHLSPAQRRTVVQTWSARTLTVLGVSLNPRGVFPDAAQPVLVVANHVSWLDIAALHAVLPQIRFVSKSDVRRWPVLGALCEGANTLFIERERKRDAMRVVHEMAQALAQGDTVAVFPEGTTADGHHLLPFHANLLQAARVSARSVLPVALRFSDPAHEVSPCVAYTGDTTLLRSLARVLMGEGVRVTVTACPLIDSEGQERRALAQHCQDAIAHVLGEQ